MTFLHTERLIGSLTTMIGLIHIQSDTGNIRCLCHLLNLNNHFVLSTEMVKLGSDASRNVTSYRLSRYACLLIAMSMNNKKPMALNALNFQLSKKIG
jgi:hypothetical protein